VSLSEDEIDLYCRLMEEVKKRTSVIKGFLDGRINNIYQATTIECAALQLRKILELIALSSLVAHKKEYARQYPKFASNWHAERILRDIEKMNKDFYPRPIKEVLSARPGIKTDLIDMEEGFLTKNEFILIYNSLGDILHSRNPFSMPPDYGQFKSLISDTIGKIINLLNIHQIRLYKSQDFLLIHMKEDRDDRVHAYIFAPVNESEDGFSDMSPFPRK